MHVKEWSQKEQVSLSKELIFEKLLAVPTFVADKSSSPWLFSIEQYWKISGRREKRTNRNSNRTTVFYLKLLFYVASLVPTAPVVAFYESNGKNGRMKCVRGRPCRRKSVLISAQDVGKCKV